MADNKTIRKIFSLSDYRKKQLVGEIPERTRETYREYGYFGGGFVPTVSTVRRLDYSNDTIRTSPRGPLSAAKTGEGTGNSNFGYFGGGTNPSVGEFYSTVDRIDYSNDNVIASVRGPLNFQTGEISTAATGNSNFGYFSAYIPNIASIKRIDYSNDTATASIRGPLSLARSNLAATGNSNFGYFGGGSDITDVRFSIVDRIDYSNDTSTTSVRGPLSSARANSPAATGNSNFGYFGGGAEASASFVKSTVDRIDYSNDTATASVRGPLSLARRNLAATGNSNFGYYGGGYINGSGSLTTIDKVDYSNDTQIANTRGRLDSINSHNTATSSHNFGGSPNSSFASNFTFPTVPNAGYFGGGTDGTNNLASIDKVDYANDTATASVRSALSSTKIASAATGNSNFGYFGGGTPGPVSTVERIEYSSDTQNTVIRGPLSLARGGFSGTGNFNFGYFGGGVISGGAQTSTVDRIDYSNDTAQASPRGPLSLSRNEVSSATGTFNFGYFAGGSPSTSIVDRVDYSNDLVTASVRGPLSSARRYAVSSTNNSFAYFQGGSGPAGNTSIIDRLNYSNDNVAMSIRSFLTSSKQQCASTGNNTYGFIGGGSGPISTVDRLDYSNDTALCSIRGPLSSAKLMYGSACSPMEYGGAPIYFTNPLPQVFQDQIEFDDSNTLDLPFKRVLGSYGYWSFFGGSYSAPFISTTERIDYANDTANALSRGGMNTPRGSGSMFGNSNFGYTAGGRIPGNTSIIERIDYSNDSSIQNRRANLVSNQYRNTATNSESHGYNFRATTDSRYERISFANDLVNASYRGRKSTTLWHGATSYNKNYAYYAAGIFLSGSETNSIIDRIDFSNDDVTASVRGRLTSGGRWHMAGIGSNNYGYFCSGQSYSGIERLDYSNDLVNTTIRGNGPTGRSSGNSNLNYGYIAVGGGASHRRLDFSNDTANAITRGALSASSGYVKCTTNARNS